MKALSVFTNLTAGIALIYLLFEFVPTLLSEDNTAYVIGGVVLIISVLAFIIPMIVDMFNKIKGNKNAN